MRIKYFIALAALVLIFTCNLNAQTTDHTKKVTTAFTKYLAAEWSDRNDLMTERAWNDYVGDMLYAYKNSAIALLVEYEIENYQFPEMPSSYKRLPKREAVEAASKAREKLVIDVSNKLGMNLGEFLNRLGQETNSGSADVRLTDVNVLENQTNATAECRLNGVSVSIPMRFKLVDGTWKFDGKNETLFFDRQR